MTGHDDSATEAARELEKIYGAERHDSHAAHIATVARAYLTAVEALEEAIDELVDLYSAEGEEGDESTPLRNIYPSKWQLIDRLRAVLSGRE